MTSILKESPKSHNKLKNSPLKGFSKTNIHATYIKTFLELKGYFFLAPTLVEIGRHYETSKTPRKIRSQLVDLRTYCGTLVKFTSYRRDGLHFKFIVIFTCIASLSVITVKNQCPIRGLRHILYAYKILCYTIEFQHVWITSNEYRTLQMEQKQQKLQLIPRIILIFYIIPSILSAKTI